MICAESIQSLIAKNKADADVLRLISDCLLSFHVYHYRIAEMETWLMLYDYHNLERKDYQATYTDLDKSRKISHDSVISSIGILNRLCEQNSIRLIYDGIVSEERPYRVEIADAVLLYVSEVVSKRNK